MRREHIDMRGFLERVRRIGGRAYLVGGCVRDELRGTEPHDRDIAVAGASRDAFEAAFPGAAPVGRQFPVYRLFIDGAFVEVALARRDRKIAPGHDGFEITHAPDVTIEEDLLRRDITVNAIAREIESGELIDPFGGARDIAARVIRPVSDHFVEDPLRALRAARFAATLEYELMPETAEMMARCRDEVAHLSAHRTWGELERALGARRPSIFFRELARAGILDVSFPEIWALIGRVQPTRYHPEGDAFEHTMIVLDRVASRTPDTKTRFSALMHDIGKGATPEEILPHHYGHEARGAEIIAALPEACRREWKRAASAAAREHMRARMATRPGKLADVLEIARSSGLSADGLAIIVEADSGSAPPYLSDAAADEVLKRIDLPDDIIGNVPKIKAYIRQTRAKRLMELVRAYNSNSISNMP